MARCTSGWTKSFDNSAASTTEQNFTARQFLYYTAGKNSRPISVTPCDSDGRGIANVVTETSEADGGGHRREPAARPRLQQPVHRGELTVRKFRWDSEIIRRVSPLS